MKKPLAVANTGSQGLDGGDHFLNHQKRSIKPRAIMKLNSGVMSIPPFRSRGETMRTHKESAGSSGDLREFSPL